MIKRDKLFQNQECDRVRNRKKKKERYEVLVRERKKEKWRKDRMTDGQMEKER